VTLLSNKRDNWGTQVRTVIWLAASFASYVAAGAGSLLLVATVGDHFTNAGPGTSGHGIVLAAYVGVWAALTVFAVFLLAVALVSHRPKLAPLPVALAGILALIAVYAQFTLHEWSRAQFGSYDPEYLGVANLLVPGIVFAAVASFMIGIALGTRGSSRQ
jgi:predicted metal-binding membrane protein